MEVSCLRLPPAAKVIVLDLATSRIADDGVSPVRQFHCQTFDFAAIEIGFALQRLGQVQALTGRADGGCVLHLRLNLDDAT